MELKKQNEKPGKAISKAKNSASNDFYPAMPRIRAGVEELQHMTGHSRNSRKQHFFQGSRD